MYLYSHLFSYHNLLPEIKSRLGYWCGSLRDLRVFFKFWILIFVRWTDYREWRCIFSQRVLGITSGIETIGKIQWELLGCLILGWLLVYFIIRRGLHQSGKIIWFSALFPYVVLFILLGRAVTLEGSYEGLLYYVTPRWEELRNPGPWIDGATQIFFAYSIGTGALPALGSYNKFHHNCYR